MAARRNSISSVEAWGALSGIVIWIDMIAEVISELARLDIAAAISIKPDSTNDCALVGLDVSR